MISFSLKNFNENGLTFIETIVTMFIFGLAFGGVAGAIALAYRTHGYTREQSQAVEEAQRGFYLMIRELREAQTGEDGSYLLAKADDYEIIFFSNIDTDSDIERVRYFLEGSNFKKGIIDPQGTPKSYQLNREQIKVISSHVVNLPPIFRYFDGNNQELPAPSRLKDTKLMRVYLVVNVNPQRSANDFVLESDVQIRNLKTNLGD